jgi:hypothetical protein
MDKTKRPNGNGRIASPRGVLLGVAMTAAFGLFSVSRVAAAEPPMADTYGAREAHSKDLARFEGGDQNVAIAAGGVALVVLFIVAIIL